jgi:ABC-2 type transport system ATP-binding protein
VKPASSTADITDATKTAPRPAAPSQISQRPARSGDRLGANTQETYPYLVLGNTRFRLKGAGVKRAIVNDPAVQVDGATKVFPGDVGVFDLDLLVASGTIFGLIGPSGSGKTTTIRMLTGVLLPDRGEIKVLGKRPGSFGTVMRSRIGYMPQLSVLYPDLTIWENLNFAASIYGMRWRRKKVLESVLDFVELLDAKTRLLRNASGGMQRRLGLAASLVHEPDLIFLDEPTAGIDPVLRRKFWDHFIELKERGHTLIVTSHYVAEAAYCDQVGILIDGRLLTVDSPEGLRRMAYGGDVIEVHFDQPLAPNDWVLAGKAVEASNIERIDSNTARLVVADAGIAIPDLASWADQRSLQLESAETQQPPFDDVFVELVKQSRGEDSEAMSG